MRKKSLLFLILLQFLILILAAGDYLVNRGNAFSKIYTTDDYQLCAGQIVDNQIIFTDSDGSGQHLQLLESLDKGIYQIRINYSTSSKSSSIQAVSSDLSDVDLHCVPVTLDPADATTTLTVELDRSTDDLAVCVYYGGDGSLNITEIGIHETSNFYKKNIVKAMGLCVLLSLGFAFYQADYTKRRTALGLTAVFLISCYPLTTDYMMVGHDLPFHLLRIEGIYQGLSQGSFPVKIHPVWAQDYGYAVGVFYGDLFLYFPAFLRIMGFSVQAALKLFVAAINLGTVLTSYFCFRKIFSSDKAGLTGCALYTLALYRLNDVYTRASVGEYTALMCLPLILWGFYMIYTDKDLKKNWLRHASVTALGLTGVIQSHILTVEMAALFILLICLILFKKTVQLPRFLTLVTAAFGTLLLNLGFLVPFLSYFNASVNINSPDWGVQTGYSIQNMGMYPTQLFGLMNHANGGTWATSAGMNSEAAYSLGIVLTICTGLFLFFALCRPHTEQDEQYKPALLCCILGCLALYMCTCYFPWDTIAAGGDTFDKLVSTLQFPWRFLSIATVLLCLPSCYVIVNFKKFLSAPMLPVMSALLAVLLLVSCGWYYYDFTYTAEPYRVYDTSELNSMSLYSGEYLPTGTNTSQIKANAIYCDEGITVNNYSKKGTTLSAYITSSTGGTIDFPLLYYPDYVCTNLTTGETLSTEAGYNNMVRITVPEGFEGQLTIGFREPIVWRIAELTSLLTCLAVATVILYPAVSAAWQKLSVTFKHATQEDDKDYTSKSKSA